MARPYLPRRLWFPKFDNRAERFGVQVIPPPPPAVAQCGITWSPCSWLKKAANWLGDGEVKITETQKLCITQVGSTL